MRMIYPAPVARRQSRHPSRVKPGPPAAILHNGPMVESFTLAVPDAELADLRQRLLATRWPERETDPAQGVGLAELQSLCAYWAEGHDWRRVESRMNAIGQFRTTIDGLSIHFLHARSPVPDAFPLILTHGWPGSVIEFLDALEPLTRAGFHCVVPSLPGYGFSDKPAEPGWGVERIARAWATLMARLGYERYGAQGSDWGTSVSASLAQQDREHVAGVHLMPPLAPPDPDTLTGLTEREQSALDALRRGADNDSGYSTEHRTRPQTIGYALVDSPVALAAWTVEKIRAWTDPRSDLSRDAVLDNVTLYWLTGTGASSARLYWESLADVSRWLEGPLEPHDLVHAPVGCSIFPYELQRPSRRWAARRFTDIRYWNEPDRGGHFPAWEQPELFAAEVTSFFALVR
jgi:pimeloyl-ACP methyl ester carboxylesterase